MSTLRRACVGFVTACVALMLLWACTNSDPAAPKAQAAAANAKPAAAVTVDFEKDELGKPPAGFTTARTGNGAPGAWVVQEDATAPAGKKVLAQTSKDDTDYRFPVCIYDGLTAKDVAVTVQFKAIAGAVDRAAGVIVRYQDPDNYYVVRANALEGNVRLYKLEAGKRKQFAGTDVKVPAGQWKPLQLAVKGAHFQVFFDGKLLFEADDTTFPNAGKVGLWTKADSVTEFDGLVIEAQDAK
jgi:hypothetical protein